MPPSNHSSSSHSSRPSSSSSRSSLSSSHSSSSSFRSSSSHSSSSRSSFGLSRPSSGSFGSSTSRSSFGSGSNSVKKSSPSKKSTTSHTTPVSGQGYRPPQRPYYSAPTNQHVSSGQSITTLLINATRPTHIYGRRRNYVYYPEIWHDPVSGREYQPGYYDDAGVRYESVAFKDESNQYHNVVCECPYCGTKKILDMDASDVASHSLTCESCGAQMEIKSELDDFISTKEDASSYTDSYDYNSLSRSYSSLSYDTDVKTTKNKRKAVRFVVIALILSFVTTAGKYVSNKASEITFTPSINPVQDVQVIEAPSVASGIQIVPGQPVYLEEQADGYHVVNDILRANKILIWDSSEDSWYDQSTECWLWYNTDVEPAQWQYWVEGISSDFGDYGWMEHDADGWWIETSYGNWVSLETDTAGYSISDLWWIQ